MQGDFGGRLPRGDRKRTYVGRNTAQVEGSDAATGDHLYHTHDHQGSTRAVYDQGRNRVAAFEYTPYGRALFSTNRALTTRGYTGHAREAHLGGAYYAPFRYYHPSLARWEKRDPLGMVDGPNVYAYVGGEPVGRVDPDGMAAIQVLCAGRWVVRGSVFATCYLYCHGPESANPTCQDTVPSLRDNIDQMLGVDSGCVSECYDEAMSEMGSIHNAIWKGSGLFCMGNVMKKGWDAINKTRAWRRGLKDGMWKDSPSMRRFW